LGRNGYPAISLAQVYIQGLSPPQHDSSSALTSFHAQPQPQFSADPRDDTTLWIRPIILSVPECESGFI